MKTSSLIVGLLFFSSLMSAQVAINVNIGTPPAWGPAGHGEATYYYLPDIETYYDIHRSHYIYINNGRWTRAKMLPVRHRGYDLYAGQKVVLVDNGPRPYAHFHAHKVKYRPVVVYKRPRYHYADKHYNHHYKKEKHHKKYKNGKGHGRD